MSKALFRDWCPLCGSRFEGRDFNDLSDIILDHLDSGYCKKHFVSFAQALADDCFEKFDTGERYHANKIQQSR